MKKILTLLVFSLLTSSLFAEVNFDQNLNTKEIINAPYDNVLPNPVPLGFSRYTRDCVRFSFGPNDSEIFSEKVWLRSQEYVQECTTIMVPGPNGQQIPQQNCYERPGMTWHQQAQINIKPRKLFPWESENFEVCLEGPWMNLYKNQVAYKYLVDKEGNYDSLFILTPQNKIAMNPDVNGLSVEEFSYNKENKKYTFKVNEKWLKEYSGEKIMIKVELKKSISNWFDSSKGYKEFTFNVNNNYEMVFSEDELTIDNNTTDQNKNVKLFDDKGRYLKWGFKRIGNISTDKYMDKGDTQVISIK